MGSIVAAKMGCDSGMECENPGAGAEGEHGATEVIGKMHESKGYSVVIVCTSSQGMEDYWQARLEAGRGQVCGKDAEVVVVHEDWEGGAGNGLGSLYAYKKACDKSGKDLAEVASNGGSLVIYHTAGKGTRLAPLPGSEGNNKPGVKLPSIVKLAQQEGTGKFEQSSLLTILEAVIIQTSLYATAHCGRLAVYWGDQVFVPTENPEYTPDHHADIMAKLGEFPTEEGWTSTDWSLFLQIHMLCSLKRCRTRQRKKTCQHPASNLEKSAHPLDPSQSLLPCSKLSLSNSNPNWMPRLENSI